MYPVAHKLQVVLLELDHLSQFCTLQLTTVSVTCFCARLDVPDTVDVTYMSNAVSALTLGAATDSDPDVESIAIHDGTLDDPYWLRLYDIDTEADSEHDRLGTTVAVVASTTANDSDSTW